ncbi:MAG: hypothetical protein ACU0FH_00435 [Heliomarina sp.]|uniref:hypothetical protein n=1 Tax=Heliomarina sp. TaxID=2917556 RepID=UPI000066BF0F|nr:hypothetical protein NAS141_04103 [Sulfitobacter sp. NAS-14.1]
MTPHQLDADAQLLQQTDCICSDQSASYCIITSINIYMRNLVGADIMHLGGNLD